jgi:hypothetical protein
MIYGIIPITAGLFTIPFLWIYSLFVNIQLIIIGLSIITLGLIRLRTKKIAILISSTLGIYYFVNFILMLQNPLP